MPKLKRKENKYEALQMLIGGKIAVLDVTLLELAPEVGCCRQTLSDRIKHPDKLTLGDVARIAKALDISSEDMRAAIPIR